MTKLTTRLIIATFAMCAIYFSMVAATNATSTSGPVVSQHVPTAIDSVTTYPEDHE